MHFHSCVCFFSPILKYCKRWLAHIPVPVFLGSRKGNFSSCAKYENEEKNVKMYPRGLFYLKIYDHALKNDDSVCQVLKSALQP